MKDLLRIMIFLSIILIVFFYFDSSIEENEILEAPQTQDPLPAQDLVENPLDVERPVEGLSTYIGNPAEDWLLDYGEPSRIEPSAFGYEWWVYDASYSNYILAGVKDGNIVQVYTAGTATNAAPYKIGQTLDDLYRFTIIENEITVKYGTSIYIFSLSADDVNKRLLISFDGVYAQLYIDEEDRKLEAVRFMDAETLIRHQPYDMMFSGDLLPVITPSSSLQQSIDEANAKQIIDLTNVYRLHHQKNPLSVNPSVSMLAKEHSRNTAKKNFSAEGEIELKSLDERLTAANIVFEEAAENTATQYSDAAEAVHGWINSSSHRETLLSSRFDQIGVGVYGKYYTQNFLRQESSNSEQQ
ncbi:CAP-associated domain-containing protein [Planococcus shenhongbingii]|uniref:CAP domain-containing protein n=1 Tax=Planococcus shenhongbingii TaxID=3058398 RepID=UPI002628354D|nr:CAP-associated domain-containing protein [Planococcus sp. N016]WKA57464.1 CAP-associated domain-containing protein [Planococcus sp. N016]